MSDGSKMQGELQGSSAERDKLGRYRPGFNSRKVKEERIAAKLLELVSEFFPNGGYSCTDAARLKLAAKHYVSAETCRDHLLSQRATRCAEYLLSKIKPAPKPKPPLPSLEEYGL